MEAIIYILLFSSSIMIIIETWTIYTEARQRFRLKDKLELIEIDQESINEINFEQYQKIFKILDTIEISDIEVTFEIENQLQSYKNIYKRFNER